MTEQAPTSKGKSGPGFGGGAPGQNTKAASAKRGAADPAVVALRMEDLALWTLERVAKMPRDHKFTLGDKLVETCLEVTTLLTEASYVRDKLTLLASASRALTRACQPLDTRRSSFDRRASEAR